MDGGWLVLQKIVSEISFYVGIINFVNVDGCPSVVNRRGIAMDILDNEVC